MNITDWPNFKNRLINEDCSINIFGCDTNGVFNLLPNYKYMQEFPTTNPCRSWLKIKLLKSRPFKPAWKLSESSMA